MLSSCVRGIVTESSTNREAKIKAEGVDAHKAREEFNTQSSDLTASLVRRDSPEPRHRHSGKCDRQHRKGDERWSFYDAVERHRSTLREVASSCAIRFRCAEVFSSPSACRVPDGEGGRNASAAWKCCCFTRYRAHGRNTSRSAPNGSVRGGVTSVQNITECDVDAGVLCQRRAVSGTPTIRVTSSQNSHEA